MGEIRWSAGSVDLTPQRPAVLGGYKNRTIPFERIADKLEGNAIRLESEEGTIVLVTIDALYPGRILRERLLAECGLAEEQLFLAASHTHFAPMTAPGLPGLGAHDPPYVEFAAKRLIDLIRSLHAGETPVMSWFHQGKAHHSINRRLPRWRLTKAGLNYGWGLAPNPAGERDERIFALRFQVNDKTSAILWSYACHPTDFPEPQQVSADFPGVVRDRLRKKFGNIPILYLQGFSGDIRPPFSGISGFDGVARRILQGPQFRAATLDEWQGWAQSLATCVEDTLIRGVPIKISPPWMKRVEVPEVELGAGGTGDKPLRWHCVDFGGFRLIGANAEPVIGYRKLMETMSENTPLLTAGCLDQTHGYLPTELMLKQGGYEVDGFRPLFDYPTRFEPGIENAVLSPLKRIWSERPNTMSSKSETRG